jgi:hypothetical protein
MSRWETLRYLCKLTLLAFCLRPLPHFKPAALADESAS